MGSGSSKAAQSTRKYPTSSTLYGRRSESPTQTITTSFSSPAQFPRSVDVQGEMLDPKLAARLHELGPVSVTRPRPNTAVKPDDMTTILQNRARIAKSLEMEELMDAESRKHVSIAVVKEILKATEKGWHAPRICAEYRVTPSIVEKVRGQFAIPEDNADGIGVWPEQRCDL